MAGESADPRRRSHQDGAVRAAVTSLRRTSDRTIRRECLDRTLFWTAADLEVKLLEFQRYYNGHRAHAGLEGSPPESIPAEGGVRASIRSYRWQSHCRGLYHTPMAA